MSTALRAQRHEFANQLHTIAGFMSIGQHQQARNYLERLAATGPLKFPVDQAELLQDPYLQAFIGAKGVEADERGVSLRIGPETLVRGQVTEPQDVTTVLGNLIDNAVNAAVAGTAAERWVELELLDDEGGAAAAPCTSSSPIPATGCRTAATRRRCSPRGLRRRAAVLSRDRSAPAARAWAWHWRGSWRGGAGATSRCWNPATPADPVPCSWPRCRAPPRRAKTDCAKTMKTGRKDEDV